MFPGYDGSKRWVLVEVQLIKLLYLKPDSDGALSCVELNCNRCDAEARQERQWFKRHTKYNVIDKVWTHSRRIPKLIKSKTNSKFFNHNMHGEFTVVTKVDLGLARSGVWINVPNLCRTFVSPNSALFLQKIFLFFFHKYVKTFQKLCYLCSLIFILYQFESLLPINQRGRRILFWPCFHISYLDSITS